MTDDQLAALQTTIDRNFENLGRQIGQFISYASYALGGIIGLLAFISWQV